MVIEGVVLLILVSLALGLLTGFFFAVLVLESMK